MNRAGMKNKGKKNKAEEYKSVFKKDLEDIGIKVTDSVLIEIEELASMVVLWTDLKKKVDEQGTIQVANSGYRQTSPEFTNMLRCYDSIVKHYDKLGFHKVGKEKKGDERINPIEKIFQSSS